MSAMTGDRHGRAARAHRRARRREKRCATAPPIANMRHVALIEQARAAFSARAPRSRATEPRGVGARRSSGGARSSRRDRRPRAPEEILHTSLAILYRQISKALMANRHRRIRRHRCRRGSCGCRSRVGCGQARVQGRDLHAVDETVAHMPCNPAVGGTAKGHLVREIDALGGLMALAIDATGIQFKLLNRSRGPAVWSPRAQADKRAYGALGPRRAAAEPNIEWLFGRAGSDSRRERARQRSGARRRRSLPLRRPGRHDRDVPERLGARWSRADSVRSRRRAAVPRSGGIAGAFGFHWAG